VFDKCDVSLPTFSVVFTTKIRSNALRRGHVSTVERGEFAGCLCCKRAAWSGSPHVKLFLLPGQGAVAE